MQEGKRGKTPTGLDVAPGIDWPILEKENQLQQPDLSHVDMWCRHCLVS